MTNINFPSNPTLGDTYSFGQKRWIFNGTAWDIVTTLLDTSNVIEGSNLFFTNARSVAALTPGSGINIDANGLVTANVITSSFIDVLIFSQP